MRRRQRGQLRAEEGGPGIAGRGEAAVEGPGASRSKALNIRNPDEEGHGVQGAADHRDLVSAGAQPGSGGAQLGAGRETSPA